MLVSDLRTFQHDHSSERELRDVERDEDKRRHGEIERLVPSPPARPSPFPYLL